MGINKRMVISRFNQLKCRYIHMSNTIWNLLNVNRSECIKRDSVIRSFLNGWSWNEHPNVVLHRKLLSAGHGVEWMKYVERFPYVIDYYYTIYRKGFAHRGTFVFSDAKDQLLLVEGLSVTSDQLRNGGSSKTRQKLRNRKRKTLRNKLRSLAQLIHYSNINVMRTEGVIVTDNDIEHFITLPGSSGNCSIHHFVTEEVPLLDATWRHSYWPRDTSQNTCVERDKVLRNYLTQCDWSNDPEFNIIRHLLNTDNYIKKYPLFYDYQYIVPLEDGTVYEGDCLFTDGNNNFMALEVKSLLPGVLHNPLRLGNTARKARQGKRKIVIHQGAFYAEKWHKFNPQVTRTEGVIATEDGLQHVTTFDQR